MAFAILVTVKINIQIPQKVSLNRIYAGVHFRERSQHKDDYFYAVLEAKPSVWEGTYPVACHYHFKIIGNRLDISNHAYMLKMVEDALVHAGVLARGDLLDSFLDRLNTARVGTKYPPLKIGRLAAMLAHIPTDDLHAFYQMCEKSDLPFGAKFHFELKVRKVTNS